MLLRAEKARLANVELNRSRDDRGGGHAVTARREIVPFTIGASRWEALVMNRDKVIELLRERLP
jgi:hypothetical protein